MRIIAGSARGRPLKGPKGPGVRPTSDKVKESLFNILGHEVVGARILDLFSGTGAISLEAVSRGAEFALMVDSGRESLSLARDNASAVGFAHSVRIMNQRIDARISARVRPFGPFHLIFADPPYAAVSPTELLQWVAPDLLSPGGTFIVEHDRRRDAPERLGGYVRTDQRKFGDTLVSFYAVQSVQPLDEGDATNGDEGEGDGKTPSQVPTETEASREGVPPSGEG